MAEILRAVDFVTRVPELLGKHPSVRRVELAGSRAAGTETPLSDWDFAVETSDFEELAGALPRLVEPLEPITQQWDPLGDHPTYMLILRGPTKLDLIFPGEPMRERPRWQVSADTLAAVDAHFWDWILWLAAKRAGGRGELVDGQLAKLHDFLLGPLGVERAPATIDEAVAAYVSASAEAERRLGVAVPRALREEVLPALSEGRRVDADGKSLFVRSWGEPDARPLLYWHGVGLTSRASLKLGQAAPHLAGRGFRVLALDAPGFGQSPKLEPPAYHPHALADLVPPLLDALAIDRAAFVGYSWGGDVGCHVAARHPERLTALVLLDAGYRDPPFDLLLPYEAYVERNEADARETAGVTVPPRVVAAIEYATAHALPSTTWPQLASSGLPVLLVAAARAAEDDLARFTTEVPQAALLRPEGVGHDVLADGGPEVVEQVAGWLLKRTA
jgi:pimeloyl-ACP methyl ester carboxylesterase